jgi:hypothetical protein
MDRDEAAEATTRKETPKTSGQDNGPMEAKLGWISSHIKRRAVTLLLKDNQTHEKASGQLQALLYTTVTLFVVLLAVLIAHIARMSESQQAKSKLGKRNRSIAEHPPKAQNTDQLALPVRPKQSDPSLRTMTTLEDSPTPGVTPDSSTIQENLLSQANNSDMTKILQMMAASLQQLGNRGPTVATQLPPYPAETVPVFDGTNVTVFLERFEDMSKYYGFTDKAMVDRLSAHCKPKQWLIIQSSNAYATALVNESWKDFRDALRKLFRTNDKSQQESRAEYFEHWLLQCQARSNLNIKEYLQEFQIRSKRCIEAATIDEERRGFYLVKGLPLRHATKVLEKFSLRTDNPKAFSYKKISDYLTTRLELEEEARMLNPSEAIKEVTQEVEFTPSQLTTAQYAPAMAYIPPPTQVQVFQPPKLNVPMRDNPYKHQATQSPPGKAPTNTEVDDLVNKMLDLKINRASLEVEPWKMQWTHRETELMSNPNIRVEVDKRANDRANQLQSFASQDARGSQPSNQYQPQQYNGYQQNSGQTYGNQPYGNNSQSYQNQGPQYNQNKNLTQSFGVAMNCWVCDKANHRKNDCPTLRAFIEKGWVHLDDRSMLQWGTEENPQGRVLQLGQRLWAENISAQIKRRWLKQDIDPLTVTAPFKEKPVMTTIENNAVSVQLMPDPMGMLQEDEVDQFWRLSSIFTEDESDFRPHLGPLSECNSNAVASATISRVSPEQKGHGNHDQSKVQKPSQKTILRRPSNEHIPHLKGHKNRSEHLSSNRNINKDRIVQFRDAEDPMDWDSNIHEMRNDSPDTRERPSEKQPKKQKIVDKLEPDARSVIKSILNTTIPLQIGTLLGNMPEVRKSLFSSNYTTEELEKFELNSISVSDCENNASKDSPNRCSRGSISALSLNTLPDYVLVESEGGEVVECYGLKAEHWTDPEISHVQQHVIADSGNDYDHAEEDDYDHLKDDRKPYDRPMGIEHLRRDCPKVPIDIRGSSFLALLDSGAELNTIKREAAEKAMLPITSLPGSMRTARMVTANGSTASFVGIVWGVPIIIGQIEVRTNFFVVESCTNPIILGNPFLTDSRARIEYATNGLTYCRIFSIDGQSNTRFVCARSNRLSKPNLYAGPMAGKAIGV